MQELLLELGERVLGRQVGVDELGPGRRRAGQDRPVDLAAADDLAGLADRRQAVAAGAHGVEVVEQARGDGPGERDRGAALAAEREDALAEPRRDVLERVVGGVLDPRALDPRVEPREIDELRALLVGARCAIARTSRSLPGRPAQARRPGRAGGWRRNRQRARRSARGLHRPWHGERSWCDYAAVPRYRHVLVAFDGSPEAELALAHAVAMAQVYRAKAAHRRRRAPAAAAGLAGAGRDARHPRRRAGGARRRRCATRPTACPTISP